MFNELIPEQNGPHFTTTNSNSFSVMKIIVFDRVWFQYHRNMLPRIQLMISHHWIMWWPVTEYAIRHSRTLRLSKRCQNTPKSSKSRHYSSFEPMTTQFNDTYIRQPVQTNNAYCVTLVVGSRGFPFHYGISITWTAVMEGQHSGQIV